MSSYSLLLATEFYLLPCWDLGSSVCEKVTLYIIGDDKTSCSVLIKSLVSLFFFIRSLISLIFRSLSTLVTLNALIYELRLNEETDCFESEAIILSLVLASFSVAFYRNDYFLMFLSESKPCYEDKPWVKILSFSNSCYVSSLC